MSASTLAPTAAVTIRERRRAQDLSQQRLAELADCSLSMVRQLESGYQPEASRVLDRIEAVLDLSANDDGSAANGSVGTPEAACARPCVEP